MDIKSIFEYQRPIPGLIGIEKVMMCYCGLTLIMAGMLYNSIDEGPGLIIDRLVFVGITLLLIYLYQRLPCHLTYVIRVFFQLGLLGYWYPDIYHFSKLMPNTDPLFAQIDQAIFGFQPAIEFSQLFSGRFWSELFNMGYFSYYLMIIAVVLYATFARFRRFDSTTTIILTSFMLYYVVYLFLQSAGPQFYFQKIGLDQAAAGVFPSVGNYFQYHPELIHTQSSSGLFCNLVEGMQKSEFPIAAFPSSHVGMATVLMLLSRKLSRRLTLTLLPFYIILCLSTVYIGAHYAIDVLGGWITAFLFYAISKRIYKHRWIHRPKDFDSKHRFHYQNHRHHHHHHSKA